ncbi:MAG: hypothetical protein AB7F31_00035 [Parachlamydiales bacterium]
MESLQPLTTYKTEIDVANKVIKVLPAIGALLAFAGLGVFGGQLGLLGNLKSFTALLLIGADAPKTNKENLKDPAFLGDNLLRLLAILEGALRLGLIRSASPRLLEVIDKVTFSATILAFGLRFLKADRAIEGEKWTELGAHLLAISAYVIGFSATDRRLLALGRALVLTGAGVEIWLMTRPKKDEPKPEEN